MCHTIGVTKTFHLQYFNSSVLMWHHRVNLNFTLIVNQDQIIFGVVLSEFVYLWLWISLVWGMNWSAWCSQGLPLEIPNSFGIMNIQGKSGGRGKTVLVSTISCTHGMLIFCMKLWMWDLWLYHLFPFKCHFVCLCLFQGL